MTPPAAANGNWRRQHPLIASAAFRNFFLADVCVTIAERYFVLTFAWWLISGAAHGGGRLGILMVVESVPTLLLGLLVGPLIDRAPKKLLMLVGALAPMCVVALVALALATGALSFPWLCVAGLLLGCLLPLFEGAINAALPEVVTADELEAATAVQSSTLEFSNIIAATLSVSAIACFGFEVAVLINAALYALGALCVGRLTLLRPKSLPGVSYLADLKAGIRYLVADRALLAFVAVYVAKLLLTVPLLVVIPLLVNHLRTAGVGWVAILESGFSVGSIVTALLLGFRRSAGRIYRNYALGLVGLAALLATLALIEEPWVMLLPVVAMGCAVAVLFSMSHILFQQTVPDAYKGRFFGILETLAATVTPLGYAAVGLASEGSGVQALLLGSSLALTLLAGVVVLLPRATPRALGAESAGPA